jgi:sulfonate transport system substrate-binding protein
MVTRRQTLGLLGAAAAAMALPSVRSAQAAAATTIRIGWQKFGILAIAKQQGAIEKRLSIPWHFC